MGKVVDLKENEGTNTTPEETNPASEGADNVLTVQKKRKSFKELGTAAKAGVITLGAFVVGGLLFAGSKLLEAILGDDNAEPAELESPEDE